MTGKDQSSLKEKNTSHPTHQTSAATPAVAPQTALPIAAFQNPEVMRNVARPQDVLRMQRQMGNQAVSHMLSPQLDIARAPVAVQRSWWDKLKSGVGNAASWVGDKAVKGAQAVGDAAKWAGNKTVEGAKWAGDKTVKGAQAVGDAAKWAGGKAVEGAQAVGDAAKWAGNKTVEGAKWVGDKAVKGAQAVGNAAKWAGNKTVEGAKWLGDKAVKGAEAVGDAAKWAGNKVVEGAKWVGDLVYDGAYKDLNTSQYRITSDKVELVRRVERSDGSVGYIAIGVVDGYTNNRPIVKEYPKPIDLGNWAPKVTHINGMNVKPESGIEGAKVLHAAINAELKNNKEVDLGGGELAKLDVLYTYSSTRGFGRDLVECLTDKTGLDDAATQSQTQLMLDAVNNQQRTTISAHSRGTIKTDNAVRVAHRQISSRYTLQTYNSSEAMAAAETARKYASLIGTGGGPSVSPDIIAEAARMLKARELADTRAAAEMDKYIHLIYSGNAVQFPTRVAKLDLVVAKGDFVTILVGKYTKLGLGKNAKMTEVSGGHDFDKNYAKTAAKLIVDDIYAAQQN